MVRHLTNIDRGSSVCVLIALSSEILLYQGFMIFLFVFLHYRGNLVSIEKNKNQFFSISKDPNGHRLLFGKNGCVIFNEKLT